MPLMEGEPLIKSTVFGNTAVKWLLKLWPSVSGSSWAKWSVGCHSSSEADQATQGDGDELGRVYPVQAAATVALSQVEAEDEEPQDGGCSVNAPQSGSATMCEVRYLLTNLLLKECWSSEKDCRECIPRGSSQKDASETRHEADRGDGNLAVPGVLPRQFGSLWDHVWEQLH